MLGRIVLLAITGISLYFVFPSLVEVFGSWDTLVDLQPWWLLPMALLRAASFAALCDLQRICLRTSKWGPVVSSQLVGNAFSKIVPGGAAAGAAMQYPMLTAAGIPAERVASALAATNVITFSTLLALPVLSLPAILAGVPVNPGLENAAWLGAVVFTVFDRALELVGALIQGARNKLLRGRPPLRGLPERLLHERDQTLAAIGGRWWRALLTSLGWWLFDYGSLLLALAAIGANPEPSLVLLAYAGASVLSMIPLTPGGLGFVEAGLTGLLALAGINAGEAALATLAYRLVSYWLPLPAGAVAAFLARRREPPAATAEPV
jgi:putative heme transporter